MGPDSEDGLFSFLQRRLKEWQTSLTTWKTLTETGNYPGKEEITDGLTLINKPLTDKESPKFLESLQHAAERPDRVCRALPTTWSISTNTRSPPGKNWWRATDKFNLNALDLERDAQAGTGPDDE